MRTGWPPSLLSVAPQRDHQTCTPYLLILVPCAAVELTLCLLRVSCCTLHVARCTLHVACCVLRGVMKARNCPLQGGPAPVHRGATPGTAINPFGLQPPIMLVEVPQSSVPLGYTLHPNSSANNEAHLSPCCVEHSQRLEVPVEVAPGLHCGGTEETRVSSHGQ